MQVLLLWQLEERCLRSAQLKRNLFFERISGRSWVPLSDSHSLGLSPLFHVRHRHMQIFFSYFIYSRNFLSVAYFTVGNVARLGISVYC